MSDQELRLRPKEKDPVTGTIAFEPTAREGDVGSLVLIRRPDGSGNLAAEFVLLLKDRPLANETVAGIVIENGLVFARQIKADDAIESATVERRRDHEYKPVVLPGK